MLAYPARLHREGPDFLVDFPDFPNIATYGKDQNEALRHAEEALNGCSESDFERGFSIPPPSAAKGRGVHLIPIRPHVAVAVLPRQLRGTLPGRYSTQCWRPVMVMPKEHQPTRIRKRNCVGL